MCKIFLANGAFEIRKNLKKAIREADMFKSIATDLNNAFGACHIKLKCIKSSEEAPGSSALESKLSLCKYW